MKRKIFLSCCIATLALLNCTAQTSVPGGNVSGIWNLAGSPYNVQGSIQITDGSTLTIEPGVTVAFQGTYKLLVLGRLLAIGNSTDSIRFIAANTANGWRGIRFDNTSTSNDSSEIIFCRLDYGKATGSSPDNDGGALYFNNFSKAVVSNSFIFNCTANNSGGGIYCNLSSPRISDNVISGNTSVAGQGGGIYCSNSNSKISGNIISNNEVSNSSVTGYGGGIYSSTGNPVISDNVISGNAASITGGGIYCESGSAALSDNVISGNTTPGTGGGIFCAQGSTPAILANMIYNNTANCGGGIACGGNNNMVITNNTISNNTAQLSQGNDGAGGGIYFFESSPALINNTITNNAVPTTPGFGGAIYCNNSSPQLTNNTIANNNAFIGGALYCANASDPSLENTILWGNFGTMAGNTLYADDELSDPNFSYCDVQYGSGGFELNGNFYTGNYQDNIATNPLFVAPSGGTGTGYDGVNADWSLQSISPCIDAGNPNGTYVATDIAGNPRVVNSIIDMGAYEYQSVVIGLPFDYAQGDKSGLIIYPNPATENFQITTQFTKGDLELYNSVGELVFQSPITNRQSVIDVSQFPAGIYFVKITEGDKTNISKIIVQKKLK